MIYRPRTIEAREVRKKKNYNVPFYTTLMDVGNNFDDYMLFTS